VWKKARTFSLPVAEKGDSNIRRRARGLRGMIFSMKKEDTGKKTTSSNSAILSRLEAVRSNSNANGRCVPLTAKQNCTYKQPKTKIFKKKYL